jgi:hypothetical protein
LTQPYDRPKDLDLFDPLLDPGESCIPSKDHLVLELGKDLWISPIYTPVDICIEDTSLVTITSSLSMFDKDPTISEFLSLDDTLPLLTESDTSWSPQSSDMLIDPLLDTSGSVSPGPSDFSGREESPLAQDALLGRASPEFSAQIINSPILYPLSSAIQDINQESQEEPLDN